MKHYTLKLELIFGRASTIRLLRSASTLCTRVHQWQIDALTAESIRSTCHLTSSTSVDFGPAHCCSSIPSQCQYLPLPATRPQSNTRHSAHLPPPQRTVTPFAEPVLSKAGGRPAVEPGKLLDIDCPALPSPADFICALLPSDRRPRAATYYLLVYAFSCNLLSLPQISGVLSMGFGLFSRLPC